MNRSRCSAVGGPDRDGPGDVGRAVEVLRARVDQVQHARARSAGRCAASRGSGRSPRWARPPRSSGSSRRGRAAPPRAGRPGDRPALISVRRPAGASRASHARNRQSAMPSFSWALRAPASSTSFLHGLGDEAGSAARATVAPAAVRRWTIQAAVELGSTWTAWCAAPRRSSAGPRASGGRHAHALAQVLGEAGASLAGSTKRSTVASRCTSAKASGKGVWATSLPRTLRSHAIESGAVRTTASTASFARSSAISRRLSGEGRPACFRSWGTIGPRGGGGWSAQIRSTRFRATGDQRGAGLAARGLEALHALDGVEPRVVAEAVARAEAHAEPLGGRALGHVVVLEHVAGRLVAGLERVAPVDEDAPRRSARTMASPAEPVKPVSQARRWARGGTYSPWCSSARGTRNPASPPGREAPRGAARPDPGVMPARTLDLALRIGARTIRPTVLSRRRRVLDCRRLRRSSRAELEPSLRDARGELRERGARPPRGAEVVPDAGLEMKRVGAGMRARAPRSSATEPNGSAVPWTKSVGVRSCGKCATRSSPGRPGGCRG